MLLLVFQSFAQSEDERQIKALYDAALTQGKSYEWLNYLSNQIGGRLSGSVQAEQAVVYTKAQLDSLGLDKQDRNYLDTLIRIFAGGPTGLEAIAHTMNVSSDTLEDEVEPFLLRSELIVRTRRGRMATPRAYEHLQRLPPGETA